ncbi:hypothetical protein [Aurantiacibacter spongiae]|uniref:Uncharacterized protein n=1 Tax=Aurantiacibacter spongiae TaxID=2488860 RepID=A0A3N5DG01_9SPHN|nr:hypothetical protein [Aurantiacibacter spongiae]RPF70592.1 hypothetical protein EG799_02345 [Aurantiacibacter spongiae]
MTRGPVRIDLRMTGYGALACGTLVLGVLVAVPVLLLFGVAELSVMALAHMPVITLGALALAGAVLVPTALVKHWRGYGAAGAVLASFMFGAILWVWSLAFTYDEWGLLAVIVGLVLLGVGIVPVATLAALLTGAWNTLALFGVLALAAWACRLLATRLAASAGADMQRRLFGGRTRPGEEQDAATIEGTFTERD